MQAKHTSEILGDGLGLSFVIVRNDIIFVGNNVSDSMARYLFFRYRAYIGICLIIGDNSGRTVKQTYQRML